MYIYNADVYCDECASKIAQRLRAEGKGNTGDSEDYPQGPYDKQFQESDSPDHCGACGVFLENPLTTDGYDYVLQTVIEDIAAGRQSIALTEWAPFYGITTEPYCFDRFDLCQGAYWALANYHGGQFTRAYRRLSILSRFYHPGACETQRSLEGNAQGYYVKFAVNALKRG